MNRISKLNFYHLWTHFSDKLFSFVVKRQFMIDDLILLLYSITTSVNVF